MLIKVVQIARNFGISPKTILHIGAHTAEELHDYEINGWGELGIIWVEAQEDLCMSIPIRPKKNDKVLNCLAFNENDKELKFKITNNSQSSSLLDFGTHKETYPNINFVTEKTLKSVRLDSMLNMNDSFELINIDVQGVEKEALEGLGNLITKAQYIYSEVNKANVYLNCTLIEELDLYLKHFAFKRIVTRMVPGAGWGDALYIRHPKLSIIVKGKILEAKYLLIDFSNRIISRIYNKIYFHFRK